MDDEKEAAERILASLPDSVLGKLADLIILKLTEKSGAAMLPKQDVVGSNPITRSKPVLSTCLPPNSVTSQLARYRLDARSRG